MDFKTLVHKSREQRYLAPIPSEHKMLCLDPGHTTGWAVYDGLDLRESGEADTTNMECAVYNLTALFSKEDAWHCIVVEDYRVYKWRAQQHIGSEMLTTRVIGCIETLAVQRFISNIIKQPAGTAKSFCTDPKLRDWGLYKTGEKHARDAIRHGAHYLLFGAIRKEDKTKVTVG